MTAPLSEQLDENDAFWAEEYARSVTERGKQADPSACGTCLSLVADGKQVEHDGCAQRATLLQAPDHPDWELITGLSEEELRALPPRFHVPAFMDSCTPKNWVCAVCWGDGWTTGWPCVTATENGTEVFTPEHEAEQAQARLRNAGLVLLPREERESAHQRAERARQATELNLLHSALADITTVLASRGEGPANAGLLGRIAGIVRRVEAAGGGDRG